MNLNEAQEILNKNGYLIEGWKDEMSSWDKVHDKKYNGEHYRKPYKKFDLGYGIIADLSAAGKNSWGSSNAKLLVYKLDTYKQIFTDYIDKSEDSVSESTIKRLKRKLIAFAAEELDDDEMEKVIKNVNRMIKKIDTEWLGKANRRNARAEVVDAKRKENEYEARRKFRNAWMTDMEDKVGTKVVYKNSKGRKLGVITNIVKDKQNGETYYRVKWNDTGKTTKINVRDSDLHPQGGTDWYD